jgi:hypothetical protein
MPNAPVAAAATGLPAPSRRSFFATAAVAAAATLPGCSLMTPAAASILKAAPYVPAGPGVVTGPDADLRTVCDFAHRVAETYDHCTADDDDAILDALAKIEGEAAARIAKSPATTLSGLAAKAEVLRLWLPRNRDGELDLRHADRADVLAWSLADDIARLAEARS